MVNLQEISEALIVGNAKKVRELVEQALKKVYLLKRSWIMRLFPE